MYYIYIICILYIYHIYYIYYIYIYIIYIIYIILIYFYNYLKLIDPYASSDRVKGVAPPYPNALLQLGGGIFYFVVVCS